MELSARLTKIKKAYDIGDRDVVFCDLVVSGWSKTEAAYFAYNLTTANDAKIKNYMREYTSNRPGISKYIEDCENSKMDKSLAQERQKTKELEKQKKIELESAKKLSSLSSQGSVDGGLEKDDLIVLYSEIIRDPMADAKTKMDAAKGLSDLKQMKKEVAQQEDNRTHFYLPLSCSKCGLYNDFNKQIENFKKQYETDEQNKPESDNE